MKRSHNSHTDVCLPREADVDVSDIRKLDDIDSPSFESHEYLMDTLSLTYKECKSCTTRREPCIKCGLCWSYHWMVEQMDNSKLSACSRIQSSANEDKQQEYILDKQDQHLRTNVIDVFSKETEPICDYLRCPHKFSEQGLIRKCQCKHPRNSAAGAYFLLNNI